MPTTAAATALAIGCLGASSPAHAILTRHDVPDEAYVVADDAYPAVVDLLGPGDCSGTLVEQSAVLTVAHCAEELQVGATLSVAGEPQRVAEVVLHPQWRGDRFDIAVVLLEAAVEGVPPVALYRGESETGQVLTLVGRGDHATGLEGQAGATLDGLLRRATNVVSRSSDHWLEVAFESPDDPGVTDLEGVGAAGDSGGPAFLDDNGVPRLAGLNSWGDAPPASALGRYGAWDYSTRVSRFADWIDDVVATSDPGEPDRGCGCDGSPATLVAPWWIAALAVARRRRGDPTMPPRQRRGGQPTPA